MFFHKQFRYTIQSVRDFFEAPRALDPRPYDESHTLQPTEPNVQRTTKYKYDYTLQQIIVLQKPNEFQYIIK